jgi:hypothetical protein
MVGVSENVSGVLPLLPMVFDSFSGLLQEKTSKIKSNAAVDFISIVVGLI